MVPPLQELRWLQVGQRTPASTSIQSLQFSMPSKLDAPARERNAWEMLCHVQVSEKIMARPLTALPLPQPVVYRAH